MRPAALPALLLVFASLAAGCLDAIPGKLRASDVLEPELAVGDWWTYRLNSTTYDLETEVTVVVANVTPAGYVFGYPSGTDATLALLFHMPALGPATRALGYDVHGERFEPVQWPLADGKRWTTRWIAGDVELEANRVNGTWRINNSAQQLDAGLLYEIEYDPAAKAISRFSRIGTDGVVRQHVELVANGTDHAGDVVAPGGIQVVLLESRSSGILGRGAPATPQATFTLPEGIDTLLVGCIVGGQPGRYQAEVRSAAGVLCAADATVPPGANDHQVIVVEAPAEGEGWEARLLAAGQGTAVAEVLGYASQVVTLGTPAAATPPTA